MNLAVMQGIIKVIEDYQKCLEEDRAKRTNPDSIAFRDGQIDALKTALQWLKKPYG